MAKTIANATIWLDSLAIASQVNQVAIDVSAPELDITTFGNAGNARLAGLRDAAISIAGLWEANPDPDATFFADVGKLVPITIATALNAPAGTVAYLMGAQVAQYGGIGAKVGNPLAFSIKASQGGRTLGNSGNAGRLAQGKLAESRTVTASGSGTVYGPLPAPALMQAMIAAAHVTAVSGVSPSLTLTLKSANNIGMTSPTTRATFGPYTAVGSGCSEMAGPITDTYWQFSWTVSGTGPSFTFAAALGNAY